MNAPEIQMPLYQSHKHVRAAKIVSVDPAEGRMQIDIDGQVGGVAIGDDWMAKHEPQPGGYLVMYDDGYMSYSPGQAFEKGNTRIDESPDARPRFGMKQVDDHHFLFTDVRGDVWELRRTDDPSMPLIITAYAKA